MLTFPVYCVTVIVLVTPPPETVTVQPAEVDGSPRELKVNVTGPLVVTDTPATDGS